MTGSAFLCSVPEQEVQHIHRCVLLLLVQLGVAALGAGHGDEPLVLDVEELREIPARGLELVGLVVMIAAFDAGVLLSFHADASLADGSSAVHDGMIPAFCAESKGE